MRPRFKRAEARAQWRRCHPLRKIAKWTNLAKMKQVNIHEAKTHLSQLIAEVERGEEVVIARAGQPVVRLVKEQPERKVLRRPGSMKGEIWFAPDYDKADAEILEMFEESINAPLFPDENK